MRRWLQAVFVLLMVVSSGPAPRPAGAQDFARDPRFGVVEAFYDQSAATEAGAAWERILFYWSQLQPNGPDDWNTLHVPDEWLASAQAQGREVVGLLKNTPIWAAEGEVISEASPPRGLDLPIDDPGNLWATFVRRAAAYYGPRGVHRWIIWNEPDIKPGVYGEEWAGTVEQYVRLLKVAYQVIKSVDPGATVHLAGTTFWHDPAWLGSFLAVVTADPEGAAYNYYFDVVSLHIYFQTDSVDYIVNTTRATLSRYGLSKPIWINETNASPDSDPEWPLVRPRWRVDLREQASFVLQSLALGLAAGAERIAVYKLIDAGLPPGGEPFGLLRPDHSRRPAFTAYQVATRHYTGTGWATVERHPTWAQVTLHQGGRTTRVFWARTDQAVMLTVPALAVGATLVDQDGNEQALDGNAGTYQIELAPARCVDEYAGCFVGGPTILLVEYGTGDSGGVVVAAPASPEPSATAAVSPTLELPTPVMTPTMAAATATAAPTATMAPSETPTATATAAATPTATATPSATATAIASATLLPTSTQAVAELALPTRTSTPAPAPAHEPSGWRGSMLVGGWLALVALAALAALLGLVLARRAR